MKDKRFSAQEVNDGDRFVLKVALYRHSKDDVRMAGYIALTTFKLKRANNAENIGPRHFPPSHALVEEVTPYTRAAYVLSLAVHPVYRRNGVGAKLLEHAVVEVVSTTKGDAKMSATNGMTHVVSVNDPKGCDDE